MAITSAIVNVVITSATNKLYSVVPIFIYKNNGIYTCHNGNNISHYKTKGK